MYYLNAVPVAITIAETQRQVILSVNNIEVAVVVLGSLKTAPVCAHDGQNDTGALSVVGTNLQKLSHNTTM
jgi:hypothetical protein